MNSKELLEQADERARSIKSISDDIRRIEKALEWAKTGIVGILNCGEYIWLINIMGDDGAEDVARIIRANLIGLQNRKVSELEQMLGIHPVPIIPPLAKGTILAIGEGKPLPRILSPESPEVIIPETVHPEVKVRTGFNHEAIIKSAEAAADTLKKAVGGILLDAAKRIEDNPQVENEASLGKYPPNKKQPKLSDNLYEDIKKMYVDEGKTNKEIAEVYKVKPSDVSNFITKHKLNRRSYDKSIGGKPNPPKQPEETERP